MYARSLRAWFSSLDPSEWHDFDYLRPAAGHRGMLVPLLVIFAIAVADVCFAHTTMAILYVVPLLLLAQAGEIRYQGRIIGLLAALTFSAYLIKKMMDPNGSSTSYFHYTLLNRALVVAMLIAVGWVLRFWVRWREEQSNPELPDELRYQDREISATLAMAVCAAGCGDRPGRLLLAGQFQSGHLVSDSAADLHLDAQPEVDVDDVGSSLGAGRDRAICRPADNRSHARGDPFAVPQSPGRRLGYARDDRHRAFLDRPQVDLDGLPKPCSS